MNVQEGLLGVTEFERVQGFFKHSVFKYNTPKKHTEVLREFHICHLS